MDTPTDMLQRDIEVDVAPNIAYLFWADLTAFPRYMDHVKEVTQTGPTTYHWKVQVGPTTQEFDATAYFEPDRAISWESTNGDTNGGTVSFTPAGENRTRVHIEIQYEPKGPIESIGNAIFDPVGHDVEQALKRFKEHVESNEIDGKSA